MKPTRILDVEAFIHTNQVYWCVESPDGKPVIVHTRTYGTTWMLFQSEAQIQAGLSQFGTVVGRRLAPQAVRALVEEVLNRPDGVEAVIAHLDGGYVVVRVPVDA